MRPFFEMTAGPSGPYGSVTLTTWGSFSRLATLSAIAGWTFGDVMPASDWNTTDALCPDAAGKSWTRRSSAS